MHGYTRGMMRKRLSNHTALAALVGGLGLCAASTANANVEVGGTAGIHVFNDDNELGVPDTANATSERNSALFGLRLGYYFNDMIGIEGEVGLIPTEARSLVFDTWDVTYRGQVVAQFRANKPENKTVPFLLVGAGNTTVVKSDNTDVISEDTDFALYAGAGFKYRVDNGWGLRLDGRVLFPPASTGDGATLDFEALLSVYKEWGRKAGAPVVEEPIKEEPKDEDGDGIVGEADACPTQAEDKDGFQDEDGCPEDDNDGDGVLDTADAAPNDPEDKDGFQDEDGAPELDNDGDGIADTADAAPNEPEDKDGFQDEDGAPDLDNDGDGVTDTADQCNLPAMDAADPKLKESSNGYQDADGCFDEIPKAIQKFSGVIKGITFKSGSDEIAKSSFKILGETVKVLTEYTDLRIEIAGHTDDQAPKKGGKFADNAALSQARADSVKAFLVAAGVAEGRLVAKGYGESVPLAAKPTKKSAVTTWRNDNRRVEFKLLSDLTQ